MKPEEQAAELVIEIASLCDCSQRQAMNAANYFAGMLIEHTKKLKYLNDEPQIKYWESVRDNL